MEFFNRHAGAMQAISALLTVALAAAALIGVKLQIDAADRIQRAQSARDIYREYLALTISKPEFAEPDYCAIINTPQRSSYEHFVEYLLYTAEQTTAVDPTWTAAFESSLKDHSQYICTLTDVTGYGGEVPALIGNIQAKQCKSLTPCGA